MANIFRKIVRELVGATALLWLGMQTATAQYGIATGPQLFDMTKVADNVYSFRFFVHRNMIVVTNAGVIVTDPISPIAAGHMMEEIKKVTNQPVRLVIYSHNHWDHIAGANVFKQAGARIVQHELAAKSTRPHPDVPPADETFSSEQHVVTLGDQTIELIYAGASHGSGMIVMRLPRERILHTIDVVTPGRVMFRGGPDFFPRDWIMALKKMEQLDYDRIIPGHGPASAPKSAVTAQREYIEHLTAAVSAATKVVGNPYALAKITELVKEDLRPRYGKLSEFDNWMEFNVERIGLELRMGW
jgi:glyoxylase-like metal-dependent hydrolase (beta-lactamase superfamily II)